MTKIDQYTFIRDLVIRGRLKEFIANVILIKVGSIFELFDLENNNKADLYEYQCLIIKLMYLSYRSKPNIVYIVVQHSRYIKNPRKVYFQTAKRVVKYLKGNIQI